MQPLEDPLHDPADAIVTLSPDSPASRALANADPRLGELIRAVGELRRTRRSDRFHALARAIVGQQLSVKAAATIWSRVERLGELTPQAILAAEDSALRGAGLSGRKTEYLRDLAARVLDGRLDLHAIDAHDDEQVIAEVSAVRGIGRWTAEMFLIFSLDRPDVLALDDAGLLRAAGWLFGLGRSATAEELAQAGEAWRPYRSTASLYLWGALDEGIAR